MIFLYQENGENTENGNDPNFKIPPPDYDDKANGDIYANVKKRDRPDATKASKIAVQDVFQPLEETTIEPTGPPTPQPPSCSKAELYSDPAVFKELDEHVFSVSILYQSLNYLGYLKYNVAQHSAVCVSIMKSEKSNPDIFQRCPDIILCNSIGSRAQNSLVTS